MPNHKSLVVNRKKKEHYLMFFTGQHKFSMKIWQEKCNRRKLQANTAPKHRLKILNTVWANRMPDSHYKQQNSSVTTYTRIVVTINFLEENTRDHFWDHGITTYFQTGHQYY